MNESIHVHQITTLHTHNDINIWLASFVLLYNIVRAVHHLLNYLIPHSQRFFLLVWGRLQRRQ